MSNSWKKISVIVWRKAWDRQERKNFIITNFRGLCESNKDNIFKELNIVIDIHLSLKISDCPLCMFLSILFIEMHMQ